MKGRRAIKQLDLDSYPRRGKLLTVEEVLAVETVDWVRVTASMLDLCS